MKYITQPVIDGATNFPGQNPQKMYSVTCVNSGLVASLKDNTVELVQKSWKEDPAQQWRFEPLSGPNSGYYRVVSVVNGKVLSLQGDTDVIVDAWKDAPLGQWKLINLGYGKFKIESRANGGILDVMGSSMIEGAKINLYKPGAVTNLKAAIYEHANYQGRSQELGLGKYDINHLTIGNDVLSSLKVPKGLKVTLYEHAGFQGRIKSFTADTAYVGNDFNDITSSIVVEEDGKSVTIYEHADYQGRSQTLGVGKYDMGSLFANDILSSLKVPTGFVVTLYEHAGFQGRSKSFTADTAYVGNDFNDITSSIVVDYKEGTSLSQQWLLSEIVVNKLGSTYKNAIIYENANYQGKSQEIGPGSYLLKDLKIGNDVLSSLKVPPGIKVTLYEHENFRGREKSFTEDTAYVGNDFNDITSSILVEPVVTVYQDVNYGGAKQMIGVGNYNMKDLSFGNDQISSLKVPQGFIATLYEDADYKGRTKTYLEDAAYVGDDFNDKTSSIMVKAMGVVIPDGALKFGSIISLKSFHGKYLSADPNGTLKANVDWSKDWEHYTIVRSGATKNKTYLSYGDVVSLKSFHGKFFTATPDGKCAFDSNSTNEGQQFVIVRAGTTKDMSFVTPGDTIGLKSHYNKYMSAWPDGRCAVDKDWIKEWEHWTVAGISTPPETSTSPETVPETCGAAACGAAACAADYCGAAACGAAAGLFSACGIAASVVAVCGANVAGIAGCVAAAYGATVVGIAGCGADTCGAAACGAAAGGLSACGANACGAAACGAAACGAAACGAAACGGDACPIAVAGADACAAEASAIQACGADACAANVCAINACPADACAADACAIDVIPIIPFI